MMISVRNYPKKVTKEREDYQSLKIGLAEISGKKDGLSRILSTEKNAEEKNQADLRTAEEGLAAITENLALLEERLAGFGDIPVMEADEKKCLTEKSCGRFGCPPHGNPH